VARTYIKLSFGKYLLELDLLHSIDDETVEALAKGDGTLMLKMRKDEADVASRGIWPTLTIPFDMYDKKMLRMRRAEAVEERRAKEQQIREVAKEKKRDLERLVLQARIDTEMAQRACHEERQAEERHAFFSSEVVAVSSTSKASSTSSFPAKSVIPGVRNATEGPTTVLVAFTPRLFPTPMRESKKVEEESWIDRHKPEWRERHQQGRQQIEQAGKNESDDNRTVSERDPMWLKARGDKSYCIGDFESAINAYTAALQSQVPLNSRHLVLGNRALSFLQVGQYHECVEDCTEALAILLANGHHENGEHVGGCVRMYVRRAAAFCELGEYAKSLNDYR
jgi:dyslexia susceptibility 1 candidate gene 1 protein